MKRAVFALAAALLCVALPVQASAACLTSAEAESIALVAMPDLIRQTGQICAATLPATSLVRRPQSAFLQRYDAAADAAWPAAKLAVVKLSDPAMEMLLQSDFARPMLTSLLVPLLVGRIATNDCGTIDRLVSLLEPLPPRNTAGIVVTTLQYLKAEKAKGNGAVADVPDLPVCTRGTR